MREDLMELLQGLRAAVVDFEPDSFTGEACAVLAEELATTVKVCTAARDRAAVRAGSCGAHEERGFADVSDWLARASGSTAGSAKAALDTVAALEAQPEAKAALAAGELSLAQARELLRTEAECPGTAADLLEVAKHNSLKTLKEKARDRRVRAIDPEELHALQHAAMHARHWINQLGNVRVELELAPEFGVPFTNRLDAETDRVSQERRRAANKRRRRGQLLDHPATETTQQRAHDTAKAFIRMIETGGKGKAHQADLVIVCDLRAYRRGHAEDGEQCHIIWRRTHPGFTGETARARRLPQGRDAQRTEIHTIAHFGRRYPAVLRTALMPGAPPDFEGRICSEPGCDRRYHLEHDHIHPCANGGQTSFANLGSPAGPTTESRPSETARPAASAANPAGPTSRRVGPQLSEPTGPTSPPNLENRIVKPCDAPSWSTQ